MLSIAVCDDEIIECCNIAGAIKEILDEMKIPCTIRQFCSGRELIRSAGNFDIIFLDIIMHDLDGMRTAQIFREKAFDKILIFISSSRDYVFDAYDVEAFQYLLKPLDKQKLKRVLQKAVWKTEMPSQEFIVVNKERQTTKWFLKDIYYFEIRGRMVEIHGTNGVFTYYERIENLERKLGSSFFRCHRSFLINLRHLKSYKNGTAYMEDGRQIPVSRLRSKEFSNVILQYMKTGI